MAENTNSRRERIAQKRKDILRKLILFGGIGFGALFLIGIIVVVFRFGSVATQTIFNDDIELKQQDERVNILLLGIGGGSHDGPNLTDTIIFASIDPKMKKITLVSIPRDFWIPDEQTKINSIYAFGEEQEEGLGLENTKKVVSQIVGQPVDYAIRIDFEGFVKAVDLMGGLDINVERQLDDYEYPISGKESDTCGFEGEEFEKRATVSATEQKEAFPCRYEHIHFDVGEQHMDGITALKYVRSRHAVGSEGSDFARSKRQEKVISAFRDKIFSLGTILNPVKIVNLYNVLSDSIATDINESEYDDFIKLAQKMEEAATQSVILDFGNENEERFGLLTNPPVTDEYRGQWVIAPRAGNGDYSEIHTYVACMLTGNDCDITETAVISIPKTIE